MSVLAEPERLEHLLQREALPGARGEPRRFDHAIALRRLRASWIVDAEPAWRRREELAEPAPHREWKPDRVIAREIPAGRALGDVKSPTLEITDVSINGDKALVSVHTSPAGQKASNDALQLVEENGSWRISSLDDPSGGSSSAPSSTTPPPTTTSKAYPNGTD